MKASIVHRGLAPNTDIELREREMVEVQTSDGTRYWLSENPNGALQVLQHPWGNTRMAITPHAGNVVHIRREG